MNELNRLVRRGAERLGYSGFVTQHNREGCVKSGYCILGCSYNAKQSMLVTYVPRADAAGARIYANARADRIEIGSGRARRVHGRVVDLAGRERGRIEVAAKVVVVAAGLRSRPPRTIIRRDYGKKTIRFAQNKEEYTKWRGAYLRHI